MSKYTDYEAIELDIDLSNPFTSLCNELIKESRSRLTHLVAITGLEETQVLRYFYWIGTYALAECMFTSDEINCDKKLQETLNSLYNDAQEAFNELNQLSQTVFTWDQATSLAASITSTEMMFDEITIDRESKNLSETEQYDNFKRIIKIINTADFLIGHTMHDVVEEKHMIQIKKMASTGGKAKAKNYSTLMNPIFEDVYNLFKKTNPLTGKKWKNKSECTRYFIREFHKKYPTTGIELDSKKLVSEITKRINKPFC